MAKLCRASLFDAELRSADLYAFTAASGSWDWRAILPVLYQALDFNLEFSEDAMAC